MKTKQKNGAGKNGAAMAEVENTIEIQLPEVNFQEVVFKIKGIAPLIVNRFSEKAKNMILDKQMKKAPKAKEAKDPEQQYLDSLYFFPDKKRTGFPAVGFKAAMVRAGKQLGLPMTDTRGKFHVIPDENDLVLIKGSHHKREDMVRIANGVSDVRFRGEYIDWTAEVRIRYNASTISNEQLAQLLKYAGFSCGIGEWRPEKSNSGSYGLFDIIG